MQNIDCQQLLIKPEAPILEALKIIDEGEQKIALVVDDRFSLLGTVTDGDVRRGLLSGISLNDPVSLVMNKNPIVAENSKPHSEYLEKMKAKEILQLPVVDAANRLVAVRFLKELVKEIDSSNPVVLMAGGLGSRMRPLTDDCPKPMLKVGGKPILENIINSFSSFGFKEFIVTVNYKHNMIEDYFGDGSQHGVNISYARETRKLGTAGALSLIRDKLHKPFFVMNGDLVTGLNFRQLLSFHRDHEAAATMCVQQHQMQIPFGVIQLDGHKIEGIQEKPIESYHVNAGIYVLNPEALKYVDDSKYLDMPTLFERILDDGKSAIGFAVREDWMDVGTPEDLSKAKEVFVPPHPISSVGLV